MAQQPNEQEVEKMVRDYQMVQEQLRMYAIQLEQLKVQKAEFARAGEEVTGSTGKVYMSVGGIVVETTKDKALADLKDRGDLSDTRIKSITKQYDDLKLKEKQLSEKITEIYKASQGAQQ
ncbi:MAG: prefoldin subunit [Candidatus Micrarchaeaceae archaeon]